MGKSIIVAVGGTLAGVAVMAAVYVFFLSGGSATIAAPTAEPTVVAHDGKLGPRLTLKDRVFNLVSPASAPVYAKIETVIEFETTDLRWAEVFDGCDGEARRIAAAPRRVVSAVPGRSDVELAPATGAGEDGSLCDALEAELLHEFEAEIGSGLQLIEDAVTIIVSSKRPEAVTTTAGKEALKEEIRTAVEELIGHPRVSRVLFLNFITQ